MFGVGNFAYHAVTAFDSIWIAGRASGTVTRIDAASGELVAIIRIRDGIPSSSPSRLAVGSDAIYAAGSPLVRIDPNDNSITRIDGGTDALGVIADGNTVWIADFNNIQRIDPDGGITPLDIEQGRWFDLAISNELVWAISSQRVDGRLIGFDGKTGEIVHEVPLDLAGNEFPVRVVADDTQVVVGTDTTGGGGRAGRIITVDSETGAVLGTAELESLSRGHRPDAEPHLDERRDPRPIRPDGPARQPVVRIHHHAVDPTAPSGAPAEFPAPQPQKVWPHVGPRARTATDSDDAPTW